AVQRPRCRRAARAGGGAARVGRLRRRDHPRPLVPRPSGDSHPRLRGEQRDDLVRGLVGRVRRVDEGDARPRRARAAPDQVQATRAGMIGFVLLAAVVICTPGPDTALTIRNTLLGGRANGLRTAQGVAVGQALWTLAASAGVAALVAASQPVFVAVRIAGAAYLVWLGLQSLAVAVRGRREEHRPRGSRAGFRQGLLSNLANPKMAVFFTSLLPQFGSGFGELLGLG